MSSGPDTTTKDPDALTPRETRHALLMAALAWGVFGSAWMTMLGGAPYVTFLREKLVVSTFMYGLLSALPSLTVFAQLWGSLIVERTRQRKRLFLTCGAISRLVWLLVAALPWAIPAEYRHSRIGVFLALVVMGSLLSNIGTPAWFSWFGDMVPESIRGRYLTRRAALATVTMVVVGLVVPAIVDWNSSLLTYSLIFVAAAAFGVTDILLFRTVREPSMPPHEGPPWTVWSVLEQPLRNARFRPYLLYVFCELFMFGLAGPFFMLMALEFLKIGNLRSTIYVNTIPMAVTALALPLWGNMCDRFGAKPLAKLGTIISMIFPICYLLATPERYIWLIGSAAIVGGLFGAAIQTADMSMMYTHTPRASRSVYMACLMLANGLGWGIAPALSGAVAQALKPVELHLAGMVFRNLHFLMATSLVARGLHVLFIIPRLPEEKASTTWELTRHLVCLPWVWLSQGFAKLAGDLWDRSH